MTISESTVQAIVISYASNFAPSGSTFSPGSYSVPPGSSIVVPAAANSSSVSDIAIGDSGAHSWTKLTTYDPNNMPLAVAAWHNGGSQPVSITPEIIYTYANNKTVSAMVQIVSGDDGDPIVAALLQNSSTAPELSGTPSRLGSLFCAYYVQQGELTIVSGFAPGTTGDTTPNAGYGQGNSGSDAMGAGTLYQSAVNEQTSAPVTVGATAPTGATTFAVLAEFRPPLPPPPPATIPYVDDDVSGWVRRRAMMGL